MTDSVVFSVNGGCGILRISRLRQQRQIHRASRRDCACYDELDEIPAISAGEVSVRPVSVQSISAQTSPPSAASLVSPRTRKRYQNTMATNEKTKIIVETALISGVMPRRSRPQISRGSVLSRPMRKKLTAISSIESVKI